MIARFVCLISRHDWKYWGAWYRYCSRCGVEQVWRDATKSWVTHRGGM